MLRALLRSLRPAVLAACFAQSAIGWGGMPQCANPGGGSPSAYSASGHSDHASGAPSSEHHGGTPPNQACLVHRCCAHLAPQAPVALGAQRLSDGWAAAGFAAVSPRCRRGVAAVWPNLVLRPAHRLPFAHAPPLPTG